MKLLEGANIKLSSISSDVLGVAGRAMLQALADGETDPRVMAALGTTRNLKATSAELESALEGIMSEDQRLMLVTQMQHIDFLSGQIETLNTRIEERMRSFEEQLRRLDDIPGVGRRTAEDVVAEIGVDMSRLPSAEHLCSWAKVCPGSDESAGKRRSGSTGAGNRYLRAALAEVAWGASRSRNTYFGAQFGRIAHRKGKKRTTVAVSNSILRTAHYLLRDGIRRRAPGSGPRTASAGYRRSCRAGR